MSTTTTKTNSKYKPKQGEPYETVIDELYVGKYKNGNYYVDMTLRNTMNNPSDKRPGEYTFDVPKVRFISRDEYRNEWMRTPDAKRVEGRDNHRFMISRTNSVRAMVDGPKSAPRAENSEFYLFLKAAGHDRVIDYFYTKDDRTGELKPDSRVFEAHLKGESRGKVDRLSGLLTQTLVTNGQGRFERYSIPNSFMTGNLEDFGHSTRAFPLQGVHPITKQKMLAVDQIHVNAKAVVDSVFPLNIDRQKEREAYEKYLSSEARERERMEQLHKSLQERAASIEGKSLPNERLERVIKESASNLKNNPNLEDGIYFKVGGDEQSKTLDVKPGYFTTNTLKSEAESIVDFTTKEEKSNDLIRKWSNGTPEGMQETRDLIAVGYMAFTDRVKQRLSGPGITQAYRDSTALETGYQIKKINPERFDMMLNAYKLAQQEVKRETASNELNLEF